MEAPRKERQQCSGCSQAGSKVEMMRGWIVEINGAFYQAKPGDLRIEIQITLGIARERGHVMEAQQHLLPSLADAQCVGKLVH